MKIFDYLFYKMYKLINFLGNTEFYPEANAWLISSTFVWLNMLAVLNFTELKLERAVTNKIYVIVFYIFYLASTFAYFFRKERYKNIVDTYDKQTGSKKISGTIVVAIYIIATAALHFYLAERRRAMALSMQG